MPRQLDIAAFAGSLRATSYNRGLLRAAADLAPIDVNVEILDLTALPLFNQDLERAGLPATVANNIDELATENGDLVDPEARQGVANLISALANAVRSARP